MALPPRMPTPPSLSPVVFSPLPSSPRISLRPLRGQRRASRGLVVEGCLTPQSLQLAQTSPRSSVPSPGRASLSLSFRRPSTPAGRRRWTPSGCSDVVAFRRLLAPGQHFCHACCFLRGSQTLAPPHRLQAKGAVSATPAAARELGREVAVYIVGAAAALCRATREGEGEGEGKVGGGGEEDREGQLGEEEGSAGVPWGRWWLCGA